MEEEGASRPNIRIEIHNNLAEGMEIDETQKDSEGEEGEISDGNDVDDDNKVITYKTSSNINKNVWQNSSTLFDTPDEEKLQERAKRFALPPKRSNSFSEKELSLLKESLGINSENENNVRFDSIRMEGIDEMCTDDVLDYFSKYTPAGIEWITEGSCNVTWLDVNACSKALYFSSKKIRGMPVLSEEESGRSILLKNKEREVEFSVDDEEMDQENGTVNMDDIHMKIPVGYWRLGHPHPKVRFVLLRFALRSDTKPIRVEKFGVVKGIISESRKARMRGIFGRNREMDPVDDEDNDGDNKNPWGNLAMNWHEDARYAEFDYRHKVDPPVAKISAPLHSRLGFKRAYKSEEEDEPVVVEVKKEIKTKPKIPRMRMYADEEEEKIKRKRQLKVLKAGLVKLENKNEDLRNMLPNRKKLIEHRLDTQPIVPDIREPLEVVVDLGSRLKNRRKNITREEYKRSSPPPARRRKHHESDYEEEFEDKKTSSKVTLVIKKQHTPAVASAIFSSRMHSDRERERDRLKTVSEGKLRVRSSSSSSDSHSGSSDSSSDSESSKSDSTSRSASPPPQTKAKSNPSRPGFRSDVKSRLDFKATDHKSPLRIEISNDHFRKD